MAKNKKEKDIAYNEGSSHRSKGGKFNILALIACVLTAFLVWIYAMNTQNVGYTKTFTLNVDVLNEAYLLEEKGLSLYGVSESSVTVTIMGKKTDVTKYVEKDFRAYLDLSKIDSKGSVTIDVSVESPSSLLNVVSVEPSSVDVFVDYKISKTFVPTPLCEDGDKEILVSLPEDLRSIVISGPSTYVDKIAYVEIVIPYSEDYYDGDSVNTSDIRLYGADDTRLDNTYMTFDKDSFVIRVDDVNE
jgi:YbbR domain-containing protein